jgi:hypothetical protein
MPEMAQRTGLGRDSWLRALLAVALVAALPSGVPEIHSTGDPHGPFSETETSVESHPLQPAHLDSSEQHRVAPCVACLLRLASGAELVAAPGLPLRLESSTDLPLPPDAGARRRDPSTRGGRSPPVL